MSGFPFAAREVYARKMLGPQLPSVSSVAGMTHQNFRIAPDPPGSTTKCTEVFVWTSHTKPVRTPKIGFDPYRKQAESGQCVGVATDP